MHDLATIYYVQKRFEDASMLATETMEARKPVLGPRDAHTLLSIRFLTAIQCKQSKVEHAKTESD